MEKISKKDESVNLKKELPQEQDEHQHENESLSDSQLDIVSGGFFRRRK